MLQQAVIAYVDLHRVELRQAAETGLRYLSFLSHDLRNNLNVVTLSLQLLRHALASTLAHRLSGDAQAKGLRINVEVPEGLTIQTDGELVSLILQNLLGNAIKYSRSGVVRVAATCQDGGPCVLSVSDEGMGIAPDQIGRIFEASGRGETHGQEGAGLGLGIASRAANLLKGTLAVTSQPGVGSTFTLTIPAGA